MKNEETFRRCTLWLISVFLSSSCCFALSSSSSSSFVVGPLQFIIHHHHHHHPIDTIPSVIAITRLDCVKQSI